MTDKCYTVCDTVGFDPKKKNTNTVGFDPKKKNTKIFS